MANHRLRVLRHRLGLVQLERDAVKAAGQELHWWLLIGDEAGLPAIARRLTEMGAHVPVTAIIAVTSAVDERKLPTRARLDLHWVHRSRAMIGDATAAIARLRSLPLRQGDGSVWIAASTSFARAMRAEVIDQCGHPRQQVKTTIFGKATQAIARDGIEA